MASKWPRGIGKVRVLRIGRLIPRFIRGRPHGDLFAVNAKIFRGVHALTNPRPVQLAELPRRATALVRQLL